MGSRVIPDGAIVYGDSSLFIYAVEEHIDFGLACQRIIDRARSGAITLVTSELTFAETLVLPLRKGRRELVAFYKSFLLKPWIDAVHVDQIVLFVAAELRAKHVALRMPDAIHYATAEASQCETFLTNDHRLAAMVDRAVLISDLATI